MRDRIGSGTDRDWRNWAVGALGGVLIPAQLVATQVPIIRLGGAHTPLPDASFAGIEGVREFPDGRVVVLDRAGRSVYVADFRTGTSSQLGRHGSGPAEYLVPSRLLPLSGGEFAVHDPPNARLLVVAASGRPVRVLPDRPSVAASSTALQAPPISGSDSLGRWYTRAQSAAPGPEGRWVVTDSAALLRWGKDATKLDTVGFLPTPLPAGTAVVGGLVVARSTASPPFTVTAQWTVSVDGRVAIVSPSPYRVLLVEQDGRRRSTLLSTGPLIRVTEHHKRTWRAERTRPAIQTVYPGDGGTPVIRSVTPRFTEPRDWPAVLPAITGEPPQFDLSGKLWIRRTTALPTVARYDVIGRDATRRVQVELPAGTRLVGFGQNWVYLARVDSDDLEYLERWPSPLFR